MTTGEAIGILQAVSREALVKWSDHAACDKAATLLRELVAGTPAGPLGGGGGLEILGVADSEEEMQRMMAEAAAGTPQAAPAEPNPAE